MSNIMTLGQPPKRVASSTSIKALQTVREAAKVLGVGEFAVRSLVRKGRFPARRDLGRLLVLRSAVTEYAAERKRRLKMSQPAPIPKGKVTTSEAARLLGVCEETLRRAHRKNVIRGRMCGTGLLFNKDDVERAKIEGLAVSI